MTGLYFIISGKAYDHWKETRPRGSGQSDEVIHYYGEDRYLNHKTYLYGSEGASASELASGTYRYSFQCLLPDLIPASFEDTYGNIRYNIKAVMDIPWRFNKEYELQFTVVRHDYLNEFPELKIATQDETMTTFCCWCCESKPFIMTVTLPYTGFARGQNIPIDVRLDNKSDVQIIGLEISLNRHIRYTSDTPKRKYKLESEVMISTQTKGVRKEESKTYKITLKIPGSLHNSVERYCRIINVCYDVKFETISSGCHKNSIIRIPISIGTNPLNFNNEQLQAVHPSAPFAPLPTILAPTAPEPDLRKYLDKLYNIKVIKKISSKAPKFDEAIRSSSPQVDASAVSIGWNISTIDAFPEKCAEK
jgi:hypothetical protein